MRQLIHDGLRLLKHCRELVRRRQDEHVLPDTPGLIRWLHERDMDGTGRVEAADALRLLRELQLELAAEDKERVLEFLRLLQYHSLPDLSMSNDPSMGEATAEAPRPMSPTRRSVKFDMAATPLDLHLLVSLLTARELDEETDFLGFVVACKLRMALRAGSRSGISLLQILQAVGADLSGPAPRLSEAQLQRGLGAIGVRLTKRYTKALLNALGLVVDAHQRFDFGNFTAALPLPNSVSLGSALSHARQRPFAQPLTPLQRVVRQRIRETAWLHDTIDMRGAFDIAKGSASTGSITRDAFQRGLERLGITLTTEEVAALLLRVDTNRSGAVNYYEFVQFLELDEEELEKIQHNFRRWLMAPPPMRSPSRSGAWAAAPTSRRDLVVAFERHDRSGSGTVTVKDLQSLVTELSLPLTPMEALLLARRFRAEYGASTDISRIDYGKLLDFLFAEGEVATASMPTATAPRHRASWSSASLAYDEAPSTARSSRTFIDHEDNEVTRLFEPDTVQEYLTTASAVEREQFRHLVNRLSTTQVRKGNPRRRGPQQHYVLMLV